MSNESIINLEVNEKNSLNKIFHISGFDCANCANQVEEYLNTQEEISSAKIDFSTNKMYITYKNKSWTIYELINIINKVETDNLEIYEEGNFLHALILVDRISLKLHVNVKTMIMIMTTVMSMITAMNMSKMMIIAMNMSMVMIIVMNISMIIAMIMTTILLIVMSISTIMITAMNMNMITKGKLAVPLLMLILEL